MHHDQGLSDERGAALLSALLIVSLMAVAALALLDTVRFSVRTSINLSDREQARQYALGAETLAKASIREMRKAGDERYPVLDEWTREPVVFPIDGGRITIRVRDGANCFNLNALAETATSDEATSSKDARKRFSGLLQAIEVPPAEADALSASVTDWVDSDQRPGFGGAEDGFYGALETPYRTPGELMVDRSELHLVRGFTPELVEALDPLICVHGQADTLPLNINTLTPREAPLLQTYLGKDFDLFEAAQLIAERPMGGYATLEAFFADPVFRGRTPGEDDAQLFSLASSVYMATIEVDYRQTRVEMSSRLVISEDGRVRTEARRYGS